MPASSRPLDAVHARTAAAQAARSSSSDVGRRRGTTSVEFVRKTSRPPGRSSRAASGIHCVRVGPERRAVLREREIERRIRQRHRLGRRLDERELDPCLRLHAPRRRELRGRRVDADGSRAAPREPRGEVRRAAAELDDVEAVDVAEAADVGSAMPNTPHDDLPLGSPGRSAFASVNSAFGCVHCATFAATESAQDQASSSAENQSAISRSADSGESEPWTRLSGIDIARSPRIEPGSASAGFVAPIVLRSVAIAPSPSTTSAQRRPRRDELDELAEERLLLVLGVVRLAELAARGEELARARP